MQRISALLQAGSMRLAHDQLIEIVAAHPDYVEGLRLLAGTKQVCGDLVSAEALLRHALNLDPNWTPTLTTLGELLLQSGRNAEAEDLLRRAAQGKPAYPHAAMVLSRHYNDTQRSADALAIVTPFCRNGAADAQLAGQHVAALAALGRAHEAVAFWQQIAATQPNNLAAAHALAIALDAAARPADAERVASQVLGRGQRSAALYNTHARSLIALGEFERAESALRDCLRLEPRFVEAHSNLARLVWMRSGDRVQATALLDEALQRFPGDDALCAAKAAVLQGAGDARAAFACLATPAARAQAAPALLVRAGLAALEFDSASAANLAERALHVAPRLDAARSLLVAALLGLGDAGAALPHCEVLLANAPDDQYLIALQTTAWRLLGDARYDAYCDYANRVMPRPLKAPAPWRDLASFLSDLKVSLEKLHDPHGHPLLFQSLRHGTETTQDLNRSKDAAIQALFAAFDAPIREYIERIGAGTDALRRRNNGKYRYNGSWSVRLRDSGFHSNHVHPRGWISSACYIDLPEVVSDAQNPAGALTFGEPGILTAPPLAAQHVVQPEVGMLVLFPSYFWHGTVPFRSSQTRLTVAFDVVPAA
jgi:tetratricopeptide (TPR) repeat protein